MGQLRGSRRVDLSSGFDLYGQAYTLNIPVSLMLRKLTKSVFLALGLTAAQHAGAFTLWGPLEAWQTTDLDYSSPAGSTRYYYFFVEPSLDGIENGAPKNFGEGSRLTTPIVTYGFDDTFLQLFRSARGGGGGFGHATPQCVAQLFQAPTWTISLPKAPNKSITPRKRWNCMI